MVAPIQVPESWSLNIYHHRNHQPDYIIIYIYIHMYVYIYISLPLIGAVYNRLSQREQHLLPPWAAKSWTPRWVWSVGSAISVRHVEIEGGEKWWGKSDENDSKWMISRGTPLDMENSHWSMNGWLCIHHNWLFNHGKCCFIHQKRCFYRHNKLMNHDNWLSNHDTCLFGHVKWQF